MNKRGLVRLATAVSAIALMGEVSFGPAGRGGLFRELEDFRTYMCVNAPDASKQEIEKCAAQLGVDRSMPTVQHLTPKTYWAEALGFALLMDVLLAVLVLGIAWISRWVARGFNPDRLEEAPEPSLIASGSIPYEADTTAPRKSRGALFQAEQTPAASIAASAFVLSGAPVRRK